TVTVCSSSIVVTGPAIAGIVPTAAGHSLAAAAGVAAVSGVSVASVAPPASAACATLLSGAAGSLGSLNGGLPVGGGAAAEQPSVTTTLQGRMGQLCRGQA